jgi:predicted HTH domain antitoxin
VRRKRRSYWGWVFSRCEIGCGGVFHGKIALEAKSTNIALPAELERRITAADAKLHLAIGLFAGDEVMLGQAAAIAGTSQPVFLRELGKRRISVHYDVDELDEDLATVRKIMAGPSAP